MSRTDLNALKQRLYDFAESRDWDQFHSPKNLTMALSAEVPEIVEYFQWYLKGYRLNMSLDSYNHITENNR